MKRLLEVRNLTTRFYTEEGTVHAVNGISYTLDEGESLGIVGESGSGKSVSVKSIMRLIPVPPGKITAGEVIFGDRDLLTLSRAELNKIRGRDIAMVFQDPMTSLNPVLSIGLQMTEALIHHFGISQADADKQASDMMTLVGIPDAKDRLKDYLHQFSGGQRQRIGIAMALVCKPSLLIADEPTTALDVTIQSQITDLVVRLQEQLGMSIIWITHDLGVVAGLVDKVAVMYAGFIIEIAPVINLYEDTSHPYTLGLLQSLPKINSKGRTRLTAIEGVPPDMIKEPISCPFAPRCRYVVDRCLTENPPLVKVAKDHYSACWRAEEVYAGVRAEAGVSA